MSDKFESSNGVVDVRDIQKIQNFDETQPSTSWKSAVSQILAVSAKNIVLLGHGMTLGFPTLLIPALSASNKSEPLSLDDEGISWIGSIGLICVPFGCFLSGILTQPFGRKRSIQFINIPFFAAWLLFYFATETWHIFVALAITGFAGGLLEAPVLTYVAEITQPYLRGMLSSTSTMSVITGTMIQFVLGTSFNWRTVALCSTLVPIISFNLLFLIPESPIWLFSKKRYHEARKSLAWLRGWVGVEEINEEYEELFRNVQMSHSVGNSRFQSKEGKDAGAITKRTWAESLELFKKRNFIRPFLLVTYVFFLSHFNGMSPVQTYAVDIFTSLKVPIDEYYATAVLGVVEVCGCITCVSLVHYVGKRVLTLVSLVGTSVTFIILGAYTRILHIDSLRKAGDMPATNQDDIEKYSWFPLTVLITAAFLCHVGIRILPWMLTGEVFPTETRAMGSGLAATMSYFFNFLCNKFFLSMISGLTLSGTFWVFSAFSLTALIILYFVLPETEGRSLQDVTDHFSGKSKLGNKVYKRTKNVAGLDNWVFDDDRKTDIEDS